MTATSVRPDWATLPDAVRAHAEQQMGSPVVEARTCGGGYTPGMASRLRLGDGREVFLKGMDGAHPFARQYADEVAVTSSLPRGTGPEVLWWSAPRDGMEWWLLCLESVSGQDPDFSPEGDVEAAVAAVESAGKTLTPCPVEDAVPVEDVLGKWFTGWADLHGEDAEGLDPWAERHLENLVGVEQQWKTAAGGDTLVHWDIRPDNMIRRPDNSVILIDWSYRFRGADWIDPALLVPALIVGGHTPAEAEAAVAHLPQPAPDALTGFAAGLAGYWIWCSRHLDPPGAPFLRQNRAVYGAAALSWLRHRTAWE
ncbi:phosphotransferase [Streptomyces venezuelae]|nr:phosphotransferase [Streptomyces venezuelae]